MGTQKSAKTPLAVGKMIKPFYNILQNFTIFLAQLAYELEVAKVQQKIRTEQIKIDVVVRKKQIEIEEEEMKRKEKELIGTVRLPAEAEAFK